MFIKILFLTYFMMKKSVFFVLFLLIIPISYGAVIAGSTYDFELNIVDNTIVSINTSPNQIFVARNGSYSFNVPQGEYVVTAKNKNFDLLIEEPIFVFDNNSSFVLDLIMLPNFQDFDDSVNEVDSLEFDSAFSDEIQSSSYIYFMISSIMLFGVFIFIIVYFEKRFKKLKESQKEQLPVAVLDQDAKHVLDFINKNDGRVTQRELRKSFPMSEAKISLIVADLESRNLITKIKKGRGNVIVLK